MCLKLIAFAVACAFAPSAVAAQTSPPPAPSGSATPAAPSPVPLASDGSTAGNTGNTVPQADPAISARAKEWLHRVQTGTIDRTQLNAQMNAQLTDAVGKQASTQFGPLGDPTGFTLVDVRTVAGNTAYMYKATFASSVLYWLFALDQSAKISGLRFLPAR